MSLSKQLYIIISFIFLMIFTGNFIISVNNTKEYLEVESATKAQDTATSLGLTLKPYMKNKKDEEINSIIKVIANRGFYKELRLEDTNFTFTSEDLIINNNKINQEHNWKIENIRIDKKYGEIEKVESDNELLEELANLENEEIVLNDSEEIDVYTFTANETYKQGLDLKISFSAKYENETLDYVSTLKMSKILAIETRAVKFDYVPQWFINSFTLNMEEKSSEISDGWKTAAIIFVSANPGDAYAKLYDQAKAAIIYAMISFTISMLLLFFFLSFVLKPLKNIEKLAISISNGEFLKIDKLPFTTEIKNVALAMNQMSSKIEGIIKKLNKNLENMTNKISLDDLTGLALQQTFETDMKKMFIHKTDAYVLSVKIDNLGSYAKNHTNQDVDNFIKKFALILKNSDSKFEYKISAYRFFGSEFAIIVQNKNFSKVKEFCTYLKEELDLFSKELNIPNIAYIGATPFNHIGTIPEMRIASNEACEMAKQIGPNEAFIRDENDLARDMLLWKDLIFDIIDNAKFDLDYIGDAKVLNGKDENKLVMQEAFSTAKDKESNQIAIGTFISIAEKYEKVIDFDKAVINKVITHIRKNNITHDISINLSLDSISDHEFLSYLEKILLLNHAIVSQLVFSITAYAIAKDINTFKTFSHKVNKAGGKIIIKRFESKFIPLDKIKDLKINYIRLARDYTKGINKEPGKLAFVESMQELSELLNIKVYAENVKEDEDLEIIKKINIYATSR
ncbi:MAG: EAL domain-containing protein [Campylobacteraceae bacterium]|nr:EAL domain-containing protein [Campylobacteraceae bacterium]